MGAVGQQSNPDKSRRRPVRTCVGCRGAFEKDKLIRIAQDIGGELIIDPKGRVAGRGMYLCRNPECVKLFAKKRGLHGRDEQSSVFISGLMYEVGKTCER